MGADRMISEAVENPTTSLQVPATAPSTVRLNWLDLIIAVVLFTLALWQILPHVHVTSFNPDESRWLSRAHYLEDFIHPERSTWDDGYMTRAQPPLGSYITGLGLLIQGLSLSTNGAWVYTCQEGACRQDDNELARNVAAGNMPSHADLLASRRTSAAIGAATVAVVYVLATLLSNRIGGVAAGLFLALHPFQSYVSSLGTSDALLGLLLALAALAACSFAARPTWPRALLLGLLLGLGGATKLTPLLVSLPLAMLGAVLVLAGWWSGHGATPRTRMLARAGWKLVTLPGIAFVVFVAVYPYLWFDPIGRTVKLFRFRAQEMGYQAQQYSDLAVHGRAEAFARIGSTLGKQYDVLERLTSPLSHVPGWVGYLSGVDLALALIGAEIFIALAIWHGPLGRATLTLLVLGGAVAVTIAGMRAEFDRYQVPMLIAAAVCLGLLVGTAWSNRRVIRLRRETSVEPFVTEQASRSIAVAQSR